MATKRPLILDSALGVVREMDSSVSDTILPAVLATGTPGGTNFLRGDGTWAVPAGGSLTDGDKGDITVSASGATWTIDSQAVTYGKIQNVSATDRLLGRSTAGAGVLEEITCTAYARSVLDDVDAAAVRTTLGLGSLAASSALTGPITSTGSATSIASQTGTGTKFVMDTSPTLVTPVIGAATGTTLALSGSIDAGGGANIAPKRSSFSANSEPYSIAARYSSAATGAVYFGATDATSTPGFQISGAGGGAIISGTNGGAASITTSLSIAGGTALATTNQTGTGSIAMSAGPTFTGTVSAAALAVTGQITSTLATGTAPLSIASTTLVPNLYVARAAVADSASVGNLTGPITSVGLATSVASQTGTGTTFSMSAGPTFTGTVNAAAITTSGAVSVGTTLTVLAGRSTYAAVSEPYAIGAKYVSSGGAVYFGAASSSATPDAVISSAGGTELARFADSSGDATIRGSVTDSKGDVRTIPQNSKSAAYTTVLADAGKHILHPAADTTARIFTIDSNANVPYPIGTAITFVNENGAGTVTIAITADTMRLAGAGTTGSRTLTANGIATALKITSTSWIISGTNLT